MTHNVPTKHRLSCNLSLPVKRACAASCIFALRMCLLGWLKALFQGLGGECQCALCPEVLVDSCKTQTPRVWCVQNFSTRGCKDSAQHA